MNLRKVWHALQLILPELRDLDGLVLHVLTSNGHALLRRMVHAALEVIWIQGCQNIERVLSGRPLFLRVLIRKVRLEEGIFPKLGVDVPDRQLLVERHLHARHLALLHQLLLAAQHVFQKIFVDDPFVREVVLDYKQVKRQKTMDLRC